MHKRPNAETNNTHMALATKLHPKEHRQQSTSPSFPYPTHNPPDFQAPQSHLIKAFQECITPGTPYENN